MTDARHIPGSVNARYLLSLIFLALLVGAAGYGYFRHHQQITVGEKRGELSAIADLKAGQIAQWRRERLAAAREIYENPMISQRIADYLAGRETSRILGDIRSWLAAVRESNGYARVALLRPEGGVIASEPAAAGPLEGHDRAMVVEAVRK
ncbi:MAG TPA: hypothetical protein VF795_05550, partial [Desulfuromonadaceae bacterium]